MRIHRSNREDLDPAPGAEDVHQIFALAMFFATSCAWHSKPRAALVAVGPADKSWLGVQAVQPDQSAILSRLDQVIRAWPRGGASQVPVALQNLITSDFDVSDLLHDVSGVAELSQVESHGNRAIVEFLDKGGSPERATFIDVGANEWRLQSLKFQCSACFGSGRNLGDVCVLCNGAGWGAD